METGWSLCEPDATDIARNKLVVKRSILRHTQFDDQDGARAKASAKRFLAVLTGNWTLPRLTHKCAGLSCCAPRTEAAEKVMGVLVCAGCTFNRDVRKPSMDDGGSNGEAA